VRSQIWTPSSRLNRRTDGIAGQILCLPVVLNRPEGVAGCALRQKHPDIVSGCDWLLCETNQFNVVTFTSDDRSSSDLFKHVVNRVEEFNDPDKLVGQTHVGACVMSGHIIELQSKVIEAYPLAIITHCYVHVLNLVLKQSLSNIKKCRLFFQTISGLAAHFSKSSKRVNALQGFVAKKFPTVAPTRWNFTFFLTDSEMSKKSTY
jgi:hypothetical protein